MSRELSIFAAAREAPDRPAFVGEAGAVSFAEAAKRTLPLCATLLAARPNALALTPRADAPSLLWLYAAFAAGVPVLLLHARSTAAERQRAQRCVQATEAPSADRHARLVREPDVVDDAALVFIPTSGSTGAPRLVELSRRATLASARASADNLGWQDGDRWLLCLPLAHTGGLSVVVRCLTARRTVLLFDAGAGGVLSRVSQLAEAARSATLVSIVPTVLERLLDSGFRGAPPLRAVLVGGAGCTPALAQRAHDAGLPLLTSYGLTETASQVVTRRYAERFAPPVIRAGCVSSGHALSGVELRLRGGLIAVRSPSLLTRYVGEAPPFDADGFLLTSDRGELGPGGELFVLGRSDEVIVSAGENVDPFEVEAALLALPGVRAACVVGTASAEFGAVVSALVVVSDVALEQPERLTGLLARDLARHKLPRLLRFAESLPLTPSGKVDRRACAVLLSGGSSQP